jgi:hypothetical protein
MLKEIKLNYFFTYKIKLDNITMQKLSPNVKIIFEKPLPHYHPIVKLITKAWYISPNNLEIPVCDVEILKKYINSTLAEIESLRFKYNEKRFCWEMEFGTKPTELTVDQHDIKLINIIKKKKYAAVKAAEKAEANGFYEEIMDEYDDELPGPIPLCHNNGGKWCRMYIYLSYDEEKNVILVEFHRESGDHNSFYPIIHTIKQMLNDTKFKNWIKRLEYIMFCEGIEYNEKNHITQYVCNDLLKKEVCTFL